MSQSQVNLALSMASLLLAYSAGDRTALNRYHELAQEAVPEAITRSLDLYHIVSGR